MDIRRVDEHEPHVPAVQIIGRDCGCSRLRKRHRAGEKARAARGWSVRQTGTSFLTFFPRSCPPLWRLQQRPPNLARFTASLVVIPAPMRPTAQANARPLRPCPDPVRAGLAQGPWLGSAGLGGR